MLAQISHYLQISDNTVNVYQYLCAYLYIECAICDSSHVTIYMKNCSSDCSQGNQTYGWSILKLYAVEISHPLFLVSMTRKSKYIF